MTTTLEVPTQACTARAILIKLLVQEGSGQEVTSRSTRCFETRKTRGLKL